MAKGSEEESLQRKHKNPFNLKAAENRAGAAQSKGKNNGATKKTKKKGKKENGYPEKKRKIEVGKKRKRDKASGEERESKKEEVSAPAMVLLSTVSVDQQLQFFCKQFESANKFKISSLELEPVKDTCFAQLPEGVDQDVEGFCQHVKNIFGPTWKRALCEGKLQEREIDAGCPAVLIISTSALRSLELLRGLRALTNECRPAKLFAKHMKVDEQVVLLKSRVNIASGTPNRIKKLMDMESLGISRLSLVVLDMERDAKGFNLLSLPQIRDEFWELYRSHLHGRLVGGDLRLCFYGSILEKEFRKTLNKGEA